MLPITSKATVEKMLTLPLRATDIFVCSHPKSGTTWMQHVVHTLATNGESPLPHVSDACPFYEADCSWEPRMEPVLAAAVRGKHEQIKRRIFNTHCRWEMMPKGSVDARYIYMVRRPHDACVSFFHHLAHQSEADGGFLGTFDEFVEQWTGGAMYFGTWSAHLRSWLGADGESAAAADPRVLVLAYEEMKRNLRSCVLRVNAHCRFGLSEARVDELLPRFSFEWMRAHEEQFEPRSVKWVQSPHAASMETSAGGAATPAVDSEGDGRFHFVRAGRVGDGVHAFASSKRRAALDAMVRRTFPAGAPEYVRELLPE